MYELLLLCLSPNMIRLYHGDFFRLLSDRAIMIAINVDAKHDMDAAVVRAIFSALVNVMFYRYILNS